MSKIARNDELAARRMGLAVVLCALGACSPERTFDAPSCEPSVDFSTAPLGRIEKLVVGGSSACAMFEDGSLRCWGENAYGEVGDGTGVPAKTPVQVLGLPAVRSIALGASHTCALTDAGCVWCWGDSTWGQFGDPNVRGSLSPIRIDLIGRLRSLSISGDASLAVTQDGRIFRWGWPGAELSSVTPVRWFDAAFGNQYKVLQNGNGSACGLRGDGLVDCWGWNSLGELGTGDTKSRAIPVTVADLDNVIQLAVGERSVCAVRSDRTVWCWGDNVAGQLGDGTTISQLRPKKVPLGDVQEVSITGWHACARTVDGRVWCWGDNLWNQVGNGSAGDAVLDPWEVNAVSDARSVVTGAFSTCALFGDHEVQCWGNNDNAIFGDGTRESSETPVPVLWEPSP